MLSNEFDSVDRKEGRDMYYIKIPLRNLCEPHELRVPEEQREALWRDRVKSLLEHISGGIIPAWAVDYYDLKQIELQREADS